MDREFENFRRELSRINQDCGSARSALCDDEPTTLGLILECVAKQATRGSR